MAASNRRDLYLQVSGNVDGLSAAMKAGRSVLNEFGTAADNTAEEVRKAFDQLGGGDVTKSARSIEQAYSKTFSAIRANAQAVVEATNGGAAVQVLNSNAATAAVTASETRAAGLRLLADAAVRAAQATQGDTTAARVYATAAEAAAVGAERETEALRVQAGVLANVETELLRAGAANDAHGQSGKRNTASAGQQRAAMQQLGFQVNDVATQFASGTPALQIFAQQSGQVVQALSLMTNSTKGFLGFLGGPWGAVTAAAVVVLVPLIGKLIEGGDAVKKETDNLKENAEKTDTAAQAKEAFRKTEAGAIDDVRKLTEELKKQNDALKTNAELTNIRAKEDLAQLQKDRAKVARDLEQARGAARAANTTATGGVAGSSSVISGLADQKAADLQKRLTAIDAKITEANAAVQRSRAELADESAKRSIDDVAKINRAYDGPNGLIEQAKKRATAEGTVTAELTKQLKILRQKQADEIAAANKRKSDAAKTDKSGPLTTFLSPVAGGRVSGGFNEQRSDHRHQGVDYAVPVGTPVRAPAAGTIDVAGQRSGYGNAIYINFGGGTTARFGHLSKFNVKPGDTVEAGDVIGYSGGAPGAEGAGRSTGAHLHYEVRQGGRAVDPRTGKFRTDAGAAGDDATRRGEQATRKADELARKAEAAEQKRIRDEEAYAQLKGRAQQDLLDAMGQQITGIEASADNEVKLVAAAQGRLDSAAQAGVAEKRWTQAKADELKALNASTAGLKVAAIRERERQALADRALQLNRDDIEGQISLLSLQADLATTAKDRRRIALQILELQQREARATLLAAIAAEKDPAKKAGLSLQLARSEEAYGINVQKTEKDNAGPLDQYRDTLKRNTDDMNTALQGVAVNGLQSIETGLLGIIDGTESVGSAFKKMASSIVADLARIAIEKAIVSAIGGSFFGFARGGEVKGYATGGHITGPGTGTSDDILAWLSNGEFVMTAEATRRNLPTLKAMNDNRMPAFATGGLVGAMPRVPDLRAAANDVYRGRDQRMTVDFNAKIDASPEFDAKMQSVAVRTVGAAAEPIMAGATSRTMKRIGRQSLPGGFD